MAMKTTIDLTSATKLVSDFRNVLNAHDKAQTGEGGFKEAYETATRGRLYDMLAKAYGTSLTLVGNMAVLGQLCKDADISPPDVDANPHATVVHLLFGKKVAGKLKANRSAWKYSKGFRAAASLGWTQADYADKLDKFTFTKEGAKTALKRHIALEAYDTQKHGNPEAQVTQRISAAALAWMAKVQSPLATCIGSFVSEPKDRQLCGLVGQYDAASDQWYIRAVNQADHDKAWSTIAKQTVQDFKAFATKEAIARAVSNETLPLEGDELLAALDQHNSDQDAANQLAKWSNKLVGLETDGDFVWPTSSRTTQPAPAPATVATKASKGNSAGA